MRDRELFFGIFPLKVSTHRKRRGFPIARKCENIGRVMWGGKWLTSAAEELAEFIERISRLRSYFGTAYVFGITRKSRV